MSNALGVIWSNAKYTSGSSPGSIRSVVRLRCRTFPATPTTVAVSLPRMTRLPTAGSPGQTFSENASLTTTTPGASARSADVNARPATMGTSSVSKYAGLTGW